MGKTRNSSGARRPAAAGSRRAPTPLSVEELIKQQGVSPVTDLDQLGDLLPAEADPDAFLRFLDEERAGRRDATRRGNL